MWALSGGVETTRSRPCSLSPAKANISPQNSRVVALWLAIQLRPIGSSPRRAGARRNGYLASLPTVLAVDSMPPNSWTTCESIDAAKKTGRFGDRQRHLER